MKSERRMFIVRETIMIRTSIKLLMLALLGASMPVAAQNAKPLQIDVSNGWTHSLSGLQFPKTIGNVPFVRATQFADGGWDNALQYNDRGDQNIVSVYIYQAAVQDVGLLFSESRKVLEMRKDYFGNVTPLYAAKAFAPPGRETASGLKIVYSTDGHFGATALAIMPLGRDWIVKFRLSSQNKSVQELDAALDEAINALGWPKDESVHNAATIIADCSTALPAFKKAKRVKDDGTSAILNAALFGLVSEKAEEAEEAATEKLTYCRDRSVPFDFGIYRPGEATDRYLVSLGDSGRAVFVEPDMAGLLLDDSKKGKTTYTIRFVGPGEVTIFPAHDRMPSPQQAVEILDTMAPISTTGRGGGDKTVTIGPDALK
jgi:hypothetical protein